ncbi:helix-turn-helix domain-containing protein [Clostridium chromiireducens]|jgi:Predicted transcriptional regulators|uniref:Helix-turn-helix domain-containing protein n=1 Tax=Clostridium chromiireducens TaxID=225345 RepID=A0A964RL83_9CLOT|nr:helix-turn-helix transcriptional regulator [Clostridium chromiireducens]MVX63641.1 helix-turn-helix domain-containing protein [Clostridium chromiireducens]
MLKIIINEIVNEQRYNVPKILPNNLEPIKINYGISTLEIAKSLGLNRNFISNVIKEKANFSGISVIKLMKHFNIPFNLIYSVNRKVSYIENEFKRYICVFQLDKYESYEKSDLVMSAMRDIVSETYQTLIVKMIKDIKDNTISFSADDKSENFSSDLLKYQEVVSNLNYDFHNYKYVAVAYEILNDMSVSKYINLQENIDTDLIRYLDNKSFTTNKFKTISIRKKDIIEKNDYYKLPQEYSILIDGEIVICDKIKKSDCIVKRNSIEFNVLSEIIVNLTKLNYLREYKSYSTKDMANKLGVSEDTYIAIEKGYQKLSAQTMWKIELEFGVLLHSVLNIDEYYKKYCTE